MRKKTTISFSLITIAVLLFIATSFNAALSNDVYVCGKSDIYHNSRSHAALDRCKSGITKMTEAKATSLGKRACKCKR